MPEASSIINGAGDQGSYPFQAGYMTPGFFSIPVCKPARAFANWRYYFPRDVSERCPEYPCCDYTVSG
jgi:hypothetical protein